MLEVKHIKNHFLENPVWEKVFLKHYPNWTPETYITSAKTLFEANGYKFVDNRPYKYEKFKSILDVDLHGPSTKNNDDGFLFGMQGHADSIYESIIITAICEYKIDFSKFN